MNPLYILPSAVMTGIFVAIQVYMYGECGTIHNEKLYESCLGVLNNGWLGFVILITITIVFSWYHYKDHKEIQKQ